MRPPNPVLAASREAAAGGASQTTVTSAAATARRRSVSSQVGQSSVTNMTTAGPAASRSASATGPPVVLGSVNAGAIPGTYREGVSRARAKGRREPVTEPYLIVIAA